MSGNLTAWIGILVGWPFVIVGMILSILAIIKTAPRTFFLAAIFFLPMSFYLSGSNSWMGKSAMLILPVTLLCWYTLNKGFIKTTIMLISSILIYYSYIGYVVVLSS
jgi:hypothetical protein